MSVSIGAKCIWEGNEVPNKSEEVRRLVRTGDYQKALSIVKTFRRGITRAQYDAMVRAYECIVHPGFYRSIGADLKADIEAGINVLVSLYG